MRVGTDYVAGNLVQIVDGTQQFLQFATLLHTSLAWPFTNVVLRQID